MRIHTLIITLVAAGVVVSAFFVFDMRQYVDLFPCTLYVTNNEKSECAFSVIERELNQEGIAAALDTFLTASRMFPHGLDMDCHAGIHRVGDMVYYDLYSSNPNIRAFEFPEETLICNRGFYHGIIEHMMQNRPDPQFIADTCLYFEEFSDLNMKVVSHTCFHAAGHGLFRNQAERVPKEEWGNPAAFVTDPVRICQNLPGASDFHKYNCTTGVESIYVQTSMAREFGLKDPNTEDALAVCDLLDPSLHESCYNVRSLMEAQVDDDYRDIMNDCIPNTQELIRACIRGAVVGLFVNGANVISFAKILDMCKDPLIADYGNSGYCYERLITSMSYEYRDTFVPECGAFPPEYRARCAQVYPSV